MFWNFLLNNVHREEERNGVFYLVTSNQLHPEFPSMFGTGHRNCDEYRMAEGTVRCCYCVKGVICPVWFMKVVPVFEINLIFIRAIRFVARPPTTTDWMVSFDLVSTVKFTARGSPSCTEYDLFWWKLIGASQSSGATSVESPGTERAEICRWYCNLPSNVVNDKISRRLFSLGRWWHASVDVTWLCFDSTQLL